MSVTVDGLPGIWEIAAFRWRQNRTLAGFWVRPPGTTVSVTAVNKRDCLPVEDR